MKTITVAVIDDEAIHYAMLKTALAKLSSSIITIHFSDGQKACDYLVAHASDALMLPDYIFLDVHMPRMDGWEFLKYFEKIKDTLTKQGTIYVHSSLSEHYQTAVEHPLVSDFINKPVLQDRVLEILADAISEL